MRGTGKTPNPLFEHDDDDDDNMRNLPETPIIFLVYSPKSYFPAFWGPF
jgi:hypothetical protein